MTKYDPDYYNKATCRKDFLKKILAIEILFNHLDNNMFCLDADAPPAWRASSEEGS